MLITSHTTHNTKQTATTTVHTQRVNRVEAMSANQRTMVLALMYSDPLTLLSALSSTLDTSSEHTDKQTHDVFRPTDTAVSTQQHCGHLV